MEHITAYSDVDIGSPDRKRLEDHARDIRIYTLGGLHLQVGIVCDGVGSSEWGIQAAQDTARIIVSYLQQSSDKSISDLLIRAVEAANTHVHQNIPDGNSTVALTVIDLDDNNGRLYIASVGDSPIYIIRSGKMLRLNTDHTLANEHILDGMLPDQAHRLESAYALTRAIGADESVQVDIGFYTSENTTRETALAQGRVGLQLKEGDTIIAVSDGMVALNPEDGLPYVRTSEFVRHALDTDAAMAARSLISYAKARSPQDNLAISLAFIPSRRRKRVGRIGLTNLQKGLLALGALLLILILVVLVLSLSRSNDTRNELAALAQNLTSTAALEMTISAYTDTPTVTPSPTATSTETATPTATATPTTRPQAVAGEIGRVYDSPNDDSGAAVEEGERIDAETFTHLLIDGGEVIEEAASFFLQPQTGLEFDRVDNRAGNPRIEVILYPAGDVFVMTGQYAIGGVSISLQQDANIQFTGNGVCFASDYIAEDQIAFACYSDGESVCGYEVNRGEAVDVVGGQRVVIDLEARAAVAEAEPISYQQAIVYYEAIQNVAGFTPECLQPLVDLDLDGVLNEDDACVQESGSPEMQGCPTPLPPLDSDGDGVPDDRDACPAFFGTASNGCRPDGCCAS